MTKEIKGNSGTSAIKPEEERWRHYPHLDATLMAQKPHIVESIAKTQSELERLQREGTEREKERARTAAKAYEQVTALYQSLLNLRDESLGPNSNKRGRATDNKTGAKNGNHG